MIDSQRHDLAVNTETGVAIWPLTLHSVKIEESIFASTFRVVYRFYHPNLIEIPIFQVVGERSYYDPDRLSEFIPGQALEIQNAIEIERLGTDFYGNDSQKIGLVFREQDRDVNELLMEVVYRGYFKHIYDLRSFPFDQQEMTISMKIWRKTEADLSRRWVEDCIPSGKIDKTMLALPDYAIRDHSVSLQNESSSLDLIFKLKAVRRPWFYTISTTIALAVIIFLSLTTFTLPIEGRADKIAIAGSLLLATIAVKFVVAADVPRVPYLTRLDIEILSVFAFMLLVAVIHSQISTPDQQQIGFVTAASIAACVLFSMILRPLIHWRKRVRQRKEDPLFVPKVPPLKK